MPARNNPLRPSPKTEKVIRGVVKDDSQCKVIKSQLFSNPEAAREWARAEIKNAQKLKRRRTVKIIITQEEMYRT